MGRLYGSMAKADPRLDERISRCFCRGQWDYLLRSASAAAPAAAIAAHGLSQPVSPETMTTPPVTSPAVVQHFGEDPGARIAAHWSRPRVIEADGDRPWMIPPETEILLTTPSEGWERAPRQRPGSWPSGLKWIRLASAGVDFYPDWLLRSARVTSGRGLTSAPIAEFALTAVLAHEKDFHGIFVRDAESWRQRALGLAAGKIVAVLGYGAIGRRVAFLAGALGLGVKVLRRRPWPESAIAGDLESAIRPAADISALLEGADHLVLALPLTAETRHIVGPELLERAKPGLHIVNVARGGLIDQAALLRALESGRVGAATLDVTDPEPLPTGHPLYAHPRVRISPHISWNTGDAVDRVLVRFLENLDRFLRGDQLLEEIDPTRGY
jgi:phosphoglycerate dehydrogenase-like enzyme